ncbi:MAG: S41 family peptidase [Saprospiraceae bacterium]|nr:S41 family peptidase [Saprospiraceae bacterium]
MINRKWLIAVLTGVVVVGSAFNYAYKDKLYEISKNIEIFINVYKELNANYVDDIDPTQLMSVGLDAMVGSLDPYTNYISESEVTSYRISTDGKYQGIGAIVSKIDDYVTIVEPYADSPVLEVGLKAGDQIIAIEGMSTKGKTRDEVTQIYRGVPGTNVNLTIQRPGESLPFDVDLVREEVDIPNVPYSGWVDPDVAYVSLTTFTMGASKNIRQAIRNMRNENPNMKGIILDLRYNGGGLLAEAIKVSNIFIPKGQEVVSVKSKVRERDVSYSTQDLPVTDDMPLVVLINKNSASASEIVSGTIQDYDRGVLMGQRSYGKGLVQNTTQVGYQSQVKLTTSKYYIPSGRCIQSVEYKDGEPVDIPDSKRAKFKTKGGRTVLDGGGVSPDVFLKPIEKSDYLKALEQSHIIFKFVTDYMQSAEYQDTLLEEVVFEDYEDFKAYVRNTRFDFESSQEKLLKNLQSDLDDQYDDTIKKDLESLVSKISSYDDRAIEIYKEDIIDRIELEIATRLRFQEGKIYQSLEDDSEIVEAVSLLKDNDRYNQILRPQ